ncbi:MAG TPA: OmpH family outer membrane protein [Gemmataceae bacterium]
MKRLMGFLSALVALGGIAYFASGGRAQNGGAAGTQPQQGGMKIAVVNIAKVLKEYQKASAEGQRINKMREDFFSRINAKRNEITVKQREMAQATDQTKRDGLEKAITELQREIQDINRDAEKHLTAESDNLVTMVYKDIKTVIDRIAVTNGISLVLCYPDVTKPEDASNPVIARLMLQTPAAMPFYHNGLDITDTVVATLNKWYPASGVVPTGGTQPKK